MNDLSAGLPHIGRYQIRRKLGQGGVCRVFEAFDPDRNLTCALKVLLDNTNSLRFKREFRSMARLDHPNIARVYDYGEDGNHVFFSMEFIEGGDLKQKIRNPNETGGERIIPESASDFRTLIDLIIRICDPLNYIHSQRVIHRDLKPANIMLTRDGAVKLMDFGLVKETDLIEDSLTQTGMFVGTVAYMSPEQGLGRSLDHRTDLYSMGVILYEICTGRLPFRADSILAVFMKHIREAPVPPRIINPDVPPELERIILRLLEKQPINRFNSAADLHLALLNIPLAGAMPDVPADLTMTLQTPDFQPVERQPVLLTPGLIGRDRELSVARACIERLEEGCGGIMFIEGDAGMGKSAFLQEIATAARLKGAMALKTACAELERFPYGAFIRPLEVIADKLAAMEPAAALRILQGRGPILASICPRFQEIKALAGIAPAAQLEPLQHKFRAFDAIRTLLTNLSADRPVVIVIDDIHFADDLSFELLHYLARALLDPDTSRRTGVLVVAAYRPVELEAVEPLQRVRDALRGMDECREIVLASLDVDWTRQLIEAMLGAHEISTELIAQVHQESGGNPFFVEEIIKGLIDERFLSFNQGAWRFDLEQTEHMAVPGIDTQTLSIVRIPERLRNVIVKRIARLSDKTREMLGRASVLGVRFPFALLAALTDASEDELLDLVDEAIRARILEEVSGQGGSELKFSQNIIVTVLYESLSNLRRNRLHLKAAEAIQRIDGEDGPGTHERLAYHYDRAQQYRKAIDYYGKAGRHAIRSVIPRSARQFIQRIMELLRKVDLPGEEVEVLESDALLLRAQTYEMTGNMDLALADYREQFASAQRRSDARQQGRGLLNIGRIQVLTGSLNEALESFQKSLEYVPESPENETERLFIAANLAQVWLNLGNFRRASELFATLRDKADPVDAPVAAMCESNLGMACYYLGDYDRALEVLEQSIGRYRTLGEQHQILKVMINIAGIHMARGDTAKALESNRESLRIARKIGDIYHIAIIQGNLALIYQEQGEYCPAATSLRESLDIARGIGDRAGTAIALINTANLLLEMGDRQAPATHYRSAIEIAEETGEKWILAFSLSFLGEYHMATDEMGLARGYLQSALDVSRRIGMQALEIQVSANLSLIESRIGSEAAALEKGHDTLERAMNLGDSDAILKTRWRLAEICLTCGIPDEACRIAVGGLKVARHRRHLIYEWRFLSLIGQSIDANACPGHAIRPLRRAAAILLDIHRGLDENLREQYRNQPEIRTGMERLRMLAERMKDGSTVTFCNEMMDDPDADDATIALETGDPEGS